MDWSPHAVTMGGRKVVVHTGSIVLCYSRWIFMRHFLNEKIESVNSIPWLGKIPIIKYLFRNRSTDNSQSELVLFVTPHISDTGSPETPPDQLELGPSRILLHKID